MINHKRKKYHEYTKQELKHLEEKHNLTACVYCGKLIERCFLSCDRCGYLEDKALGKVD